MRESISVKRPVQCDKADKKTKTRSHGAVLVAEMKGPIQHAESDRADAKEYDCEHDLPMTKRLLLSLEGGLSTFAKRQVHEFGINLKKVKPHGKVVGSSCSLRSRRSFAARLPVSIQVIHAL